MKKRTNQVIAVSLIVLFTSCQKDHSSDPGAVSNNVKTYTEDVTSSTIGNSSNTYNLTFDGNNRITSLVSVSNPGNKFLYTYNSNTSYSADTYVSNVWEIHEDIFLTATLLPDSTFQYNNTGDTSTEKYIYNGGTLPVKLYEYDYSKITGSQLSNTTTYTYDAKGNLVKSEDTDTNVETFEFYPDMGYVLPNVQPNSKQITNHNLIKTHTFTSNGSFVGSVDITYTFDSNNRISTEKDVTDDGTVVVKTYTYY